MLAPSIIKVSPRGTCNEKEYIKGIAERANCIAEEIMKQNNEAMHEQVALFIPGKLDVESR